MVKHDGQAGLASLTAAYLVSRQLEVSAAAACSICSFRQTREMLEVQQVVGIGLESLKPSIPLITVMSGHAPRAHVKWCG